MTYNNLHVTRERDETILRYLRARSKGWSTAEVGKMFGISAANARITTNTIKAADLHESGEPRDQVEAGYWA